MATTNSLAFGPVKASDVRMLTFAGSNALGSTFCQHQSTIYPLY